MPVLSYRVNYSLILRAELIPQIILNIEQEEKDTPFLSRVVISLVSPPLSLSRSLPPPLLLDLHQVTHTC
jgi:hypothetical protein